MSNIRQIALILVLSLMPMHAFALVDKEYIAFSFKEARSQLEGGRFSSDLKYFSEITHPVALVEDVSNRDIILVGERRENSTPISLDDWVVALKAILTERRDPAVSIDRTQETDTSKLQKIRFEGGLEDTRFGQDLLQADVVLKKLGLGKIRAPKIFGVKSYLDYSEKEFRRSGEQNSVVSRFWFLPRKSSSYVTARDGIIVVEEYEIGVENEVMGSDNRLANDVPAENFSSDLQQNFHDIKLYYPELGRLEQLYYLAALAQGLDASGISQSPAMPYWRDTYKVSKENTPRHYPLEENSRNIGNVTLELSGGISLDTLVLDLQDGVADAIKKYVIDSRPNRHTLSWKVPLLELVWDDDYEPSRIDHLKKVEREKQQIGMNLSKTFSSNNVFSSAALPANNYRISERPLSNHFSTDFFKNRLKTRPSISTDVGGVMLEGVAEIAGNTKIDLTGGNFSFVIDGKNARLAPDTFRKFVTALWAVYYSSQDPGISIDPIAPGSKKHMVRYIGKVINSDLGRVMREADYVMKKWAVGTARPNIRGFQNPDDISGKRGYLNVGTWSRFWFVPEDMKFKRGGDLLLFDDGRMTVKTEYMFQNGGSKADPSNEGFARFFTENYNEIAEKYPVYKELFDYAKMVGLAKYLKESGIPLYWFLLANKDLVITEDSPGTVDALVKGSEHFRNVTIEGGVNLSVQGRYVYDQTAVTAINRAISKSAAKTSTSKTSLSLDRSVTNTRAKAFSFDLGKESYTVVPQHSLTSGKDRRGIRYQTDLAIRDTGLKLTDKGLDDLYPYVYNRALFKELEPVKGSLESKNDAEAERILEKASKQARNKANRTLGKLRNIVGKKFTTESDFKKALERSIGADKVKKLGELITKHAYYKTNLELVRYYNPKLSDEGGFGKGWRLLIPYRIEPEGSERIEFLNVRIPKRMSMVNLLTNQREILTFSKNRYASAGYVPDVLASSQVVGLFLMSDASYRLSDKLGNEFWFDQGGNMSDMLLSEHHRFHFEYNHRSTNDFDGSPYQVQLVDNETIPFLNAVIRKKMKVVNLSTGISETLVFNDNGNFAGYVPLDKKNSNYEILALMSDTSYRLLDKHGNEVVLDAGGRFENMILSGDKPLIKSITQGDHTINFSYAVSGSGNVVLSRANVSKDQEWGVTSHVVKYIYDESGRLASIDRKGESMVSKETLTSKSLAMNEAL